MNASNPSIRDQRSTDLEHLRLLSMFHFVGAGFAVLGMLFLVAHFGFTLFILHNPKFSPNNQETKAIFSILTLIYVFGGFWLLLSGILNFASALCLRAQKNCTFSQIVAVFNCLHIPLGTVLGVFTIIVLNRDSVRELYTARPEATP